MNKIPESFDDQWTQVAAMTENCSFVTGKPIIHTSGSFRRSVCIDYLYYNADGTMKRVVMTSEGVGSEDK